jgi:hypothetical protein
VFHWKPVDREPQFNSQDARPICTNLESANSNRIREHITDDVTETVCEIKWRLQVVREGTLGGIVGIVSLAGWTRRAKEHQIGGPCVDEDYTLCDQLRWLCYPEIVTDRNIPCQEYQPGWYQTTKMWGLWP